MADVAQEFFAADFSGSAPEAICPECARVALSHAPTSTSIAYCKHKLTGAYRVADRPWKVIRGVEAGIFSDIVLRGLTAGELRVQVTGEIARLIEGQARVSTKH